MQYERVVDLSAECGMDDGIARTAIIRYIELYTFDEIEEITGGLRMSAKMDDDTQQAVGRTLVKLVKSWDIIGKDGNPIPQLTQDLTAWRKLPQIFIHCIVDKAMEEMPVPFRNTNRPLVQSTAQTGVLSQSG